MSKNNPNYYLDEEAAGGRLSRKAKESPFMIIGKFSFKRKFDFREGISGKFRGFSRAFPRCQQICHESIPLIKCN